MGKPARASVTSPARRDHPPWPDASALATGLAYRGEADGPRGWLDSREMLGGREKISRANDRQPTTLMAWRVRPCNFALKFLDVATAVIQEN